MNIPAQLGEQGRKFYRNLVEYYGIDDAGGLELVTIAAQCVDRMHAADQAIDELGLLVLDRYNKPRANPAIAIEERARTGLLAAIRQLGLDLEPANLTVGNPGL